MCQSSNPICWPKYKHDWEFSMQPNTRKSISRLQQTTEKKKFSTENVFCRKHEKHFLAKQMVSQSEESTSYILLYFKKTSQPIISTHCNRLYNLDLPGTCLM